MSAPRTADLLVRNATVVSMDDERRVFLDGAVATREGRIVAVGPAAEVTSQWASGRVIDAGGGVVHPGFVETHMHVSHQLIRAAFSDAIPWAEVGGVFFDAYWRNLDDEAEYNGSALGCLEMIRNGTTCFLEAGSVYEPDATARAADEVGIRAVLGDGFVWDLGPLAQGPTRLERTPATTDEAIGRLGSQLARNRDPDALVRGHIAIWGLGTASDELYAAAKALATEAGVVLNAHQSFHRLDVDGDIERLGGPPVCHFHDLGVLDRHTTLAHVNFIDDDEVGRLVESGTTVAWCPAVSMIWATGGAVGGRHAELHRSGANVSLGSDSSIVANPLDLTQAGLLGTLATRDTTRRRDSLTAEDVLEMCTRNGARAVGLENEIGSLEVGKRADIVVRSPALTELHPPGEVVAQLVFAGATRGVTTVIVDGKVVLEGGEFPHLDERRMQSLGDSASQRVFDRMDWRITPRWPHIG